MRRRALLCALGTVTALIGGCSARPDGGDTETPNTTGRSSPRTTASATTSTPTPTPVPTPTDCPAAPRVPTPDPHPDGDPIPPLPDPPTSFADSAVTAYVEQYELGYRWRRATTRYDGPLTEVGLSASATVRTAAADHAVVAVDGPLYGRVDFDPATDSTGNFDGHRILAVYLVTERATWRAEMRLAAGEEPPAVEPGAEGTLLECH